MPDDADRLRGVLEHAPEVRLGRAGREAVVDAQLGAGRLRHRVGGLARSQERAREHELRRRLARGELLAERSCLGPAPRGERAHRVGVAFLRVRMPDQEHEHPRRAYPGPQ